MKKDTFLINKMLVLSIYMNIVWNTIYVNIVWTISMNIDRGLDGIPPLVELLHSDYPEVQKNACGALKNLSYGRGPAGTDNKVLTGQHSQTKCPSSWVNKFKIFCSFNNYFVVLQKAIANAGGITQLIRVLRKAREEEIKELVTGILWNLSSCEVSTSNQTRVPDY